MRRQRQRQRQEVEQIERPEPDAINSHRTRPSRRAYAVRRAATQVKVCETETRVTSGYLPSEFLQPSPANELMQLVGRDFVA